MTTVTDKHFDEGALFAETQRFNHWWLWAIFLLANGLVIYKIIMHFTESTDSVSTTDLVVLVIAEIIVLLLTWFVFSFRLETMVLAQGIYVRFFPFHVRFKFFEWADLEKCYVRKYRPIREFGGWGVRFSLSGKGTAFNVSGNKGLQLVFANKKKLLIGTRKPEELDATLKNLGQVKM